MGYMGIVSFWYMSIWVYECMGIWVQLFFGMWVYEFMGIGGLLFCCFGYVVKAELQGLGLHQVGLWGCWFIYYGLVR